MSLYVDACEGQSATGTPGGRLLRQRGHGSEQLDGGVDVAHTVGERTVGDRRPVPEGDAQRGVAVGGAGGTVE